MVWYKKYLKLPLLLNYDIGTDPFDRGMKILFAFCCAHHSCQFDVPFDHIQKKIFFDHLGTSSAQNLTPRA